MDGITVGVGVSGLGVYPVVLANSKLQEIGEEKLARGKKRPQGMLSGAFIFRLWRHGEKGDARHKKPPFRSHNIRKGCQHTRLLDTTPHGALTNKAAYPLQSSSLQGLLLHE